MITVVKPIVHRTTVIKYNGKETTVKSGGSRSTVILKSGSSFIQLPPNPKDKNVLSWNATTKSLEWIDADDASESVDPVAYYILAKNGNIS